MKAGGLIIVFCLVVCACGAGQVSEASFRSKADAICLRFNKRTNALDAASARGFQATLAAVDAELAALARLKAPTQDRSAYADYLLRLRRLAAFARLHGRELLSLTMQLDHAISRRVSSYGLSRAMRRVRQFHRKIARLEQPVVQDARRASADALRLHLPQCNIGARD